MKTIAMTVYVEVEDPSGDFATFDEASNAVVWMLRKGAKELDLSIGYQIEPAEEAPPNDHK